MEDVGRKCVCTNDGVIRQVSTLRATEGFFVAGATTEPPFVVRI